MLHRAYPVERSVHDMKYSGGGVAGLCLAGTLAKYDTAGRFEVAIYEAAASFEEIGAGITIFGGSFEIAHALDLEEEFAAIDQEGRGGEGVSVRRLFA